MHQSVIKLSKKNNGILNQCLKMLLKICDLNKYLIHYYKLHLTHSGSNWASTYSLTFLAFSRSAPSFFILAKFLTLVNIGACLNISGTITKQTLLPLKYTLSK